MKQAAPPAIPGTPTLFEKSCSYCGARLRVLATQAPEDLHQEQYACPECGKSYVTAASSEPEVQLLRPRSDGKGDRYQETMF
jgi:predicted RNA-binding Zn-ribbon protein involved in translation (DUF1610 family)